MVYPGLYSYRQRVRVITLFPKHFFSYCFCLLSDFAKVFERKVWRVQVAHLHNAARALSSPSRCFQLSTNLGKDFFVIFDNKNKKQIECGLAWHWWNSTDLGLIDMFLINLNAEIVACILSFRKSHHKPNLKNTSKYGFSPDFGGKKWRRSEHAHASYPGLFFRPPGFSPYLGREERRVQGLDYRGVFPQLFSSSLKLSRVSLFNN